MNKNVLDVLEQITNTCEQLCEEIYRNSDYSNVTFAMCVDKFRNIGHEICRLQEELAEEAEQAK
jgi:hypothetical protein